MGVTSGETATPDEVELLLREDDHSSAIKNLPGNNGKILKKSSSIDVKQSKFHVGLSERTRSRDHLDEGAKSSLLKEAPIVIKRKSRSSNLVSSWPGCSKRTADDSSAEINDPGGGNIVGPGVLNSPTPSLSKVQTPKISKFDFNSMKSRSTMDKLKNFRTSSLKLKLSYKSSLPKLDTVHEPGLAETNSIVSLSNSGTHTTTRASSSTALVTSIPVSASKVSPSSSNGEPKPPAVDQFSRESRSGTKMTFKPKMAVFRSNSDSRRIRTGSRCQRFRNFSLRSKKLAWDEVCKIYIYNKPILTISFSHLLCIVMHNLYKILQ